MRRRGLLNNKVYSRFVPAGYVRRFQHEETSGTTATDESGTLNGTIVGSPTLGVDSGITELGKSIELGANKYVNLNSNTITGGKTQFTIAQYIRFRTIGGNQTIYGTVINPYSIIVRHNAGNIQLVTYNLAGVATGISTHDAFTDTVNYHLVLTEYNNGIGNIWLDDVIGRTNNGTAGALYTGSNECIGKNLSVYGNIDHAETIIYNSILTAEEKTGLYNRLL